MRRTLIASIMTASLLLVGFVIPTEAHSNHHHNRKAQKHYRKAAKRQAKHNRRVARWEWNRHNWNQQRDYLRNNWRSRCGRLSPVQRAQLDAQLRPQWMAYHNNNWNGQCDWNTYNDPRFFDYLHNRNPSILNSVRNMFGIF